MVTDFSNKTEVKPDKVTGRMRSPRGFWGSMILLLMLPLTILYQLFFANGTDIFVHWVLTVGAVLTAFAVFDFRKTPRWTQWIGAFAALALAVIFFLQGASHLVQNAAFTYLAYDLLGAAPEPWAFRLFLYGWGVAVLLLESRGKTRTVGVIAVLAFMAMELYRFSIDAFGAPPLNGLRAVYLVPFVWLLFESRKKSAA